jgi:hypothetical protein
MLSGVLIVGVVLFGMLTYDGISRGSWGWAAFDLATTIALAGAAVMEWRRGSSRRA